MLVLTAGVFDMLHYGHVRLLERASVYGDKLIVAVQESESVAAVMGKQAPIQTTEERMEMVGAIWCVDEVISYQSGTDGHIIDLVRPDVYVHGADWMDQADRSRVVQSIEDVGAELVLLTRTDRYSTTNLRQRVLDAARNDQ